ncbi:MAG TPA: hypothetical protein VGO11_02135 [Chthoniobacteraceae bacterium]|jgi:hypothetical protein|nr:hypothetical protein [Chthoniobacteraceae bacterium]
MDEIHYDNAEDTPKELVKEQKDLRTLEMSGFSVPLWSGRRFIGSGTLVSANGNYGILTAHHVSKLWNESEPLCLNIAQFDHIFYVPPPMVQHIVIGEYSENRPGSDGPDLALFRILDPAKIESLKARKMFLNLDVHSVETVTKFPLEAQQCFVVGCPDEIKLGELVSDAPPVWSGQALFSAQVDFRLRSIRGEFDYVEMLTYSGIHGFPATFKGVSGGGIWAFMLRRSAEDPSIVNSLSPELIGVAFYQGPAAEDMRTIYGHGPSSIYIATRAALAQVS